MKGLTDLKTLFPDSISFKSITYMHHIMSDLNGKLFIIQSYIIIIIIACSSRYTITTLSQNKMVRLNTDTMQ